MSDHVALQAKINKVEENAESGCGQSDFVYEVRAHAAYAKILKQAPDSEKEEVMNVLKGRGFDPDFEPYEPQEGECSLTGIDDNCCPCGRHP